MRCTVRYQAGTYSGERTVNAEDNDHAIAQVRRWVHGMMTLPMYYESYEVISTEEEEATDG